MFRLGLFNSVSLSGPSGPLDGRVSQRRPLALLSLLAVSDEGLLSRDKLVAYLWPAADSDGARHRLSVTLHAIRKALGRESVLSIGDDLRLNPEYVAVDVREFEKALEEDDPARAVELYAGPFMDGFHVTDAPEFERWADAERTRLSRRYGTALETLAEREETQGHVRRALELWRMLADHDPYSSRVALRLMRALERAGDRPGALRVARVHGALVREELDLEPDPEVLTLADRLENGEVEREQRARRSEPKATAPARTVGPAEEAGTTTTRKSSVPFPARVVALVAGLMALVGGLAVLDSRGEAASYDTKSVLVDLFTNRTEDRSLDDLGRMATDWITQGLTYTGFVDVVTLGTPLLARTPDVDSSRLSDRRERLARIAREHGTGTLVWGNVYREGDSLYLQAHLTDARDHRILASLEPVMAPAEAPVRGLERLRDRVMTALAARTDPRLEKWQRNASRPPSFEAYERFVDGLDFITNEYGHRDRDRAEVLGHAADRFREAAALDSSFTMARLWEAMALGNARRWDEVESILHELNERREDLAPLDRAFLDYQRGRWRERTRGGDPMEKLRAARRMVEIAPGSEYLKLAGSAALQVGRPAEAVRHYERVDPRSGWLRGWTEYWARFSAAHHTLGNDERALEVARRGRELYPEDHWLREREMRSLAFLGRVEELEEAIADARRLDWYPGAWAGALARTAGELAAHGSRGPARDLFRRALDLERERLREGVDPRSARIALCYLLQDAGDLTGANEQLEPLLTEYPDDLSVLYAAVRLRAREGRRAAAMDFVRRIERVTGRRPLLLEAEVAAQSGEPARALRLLTEQEQRTGRVNRYWVTHAVSFRSLRDYPPFQEFIQPEG